MSFGSGAQNHGALGILGPTRMDYASSMAAVNTVARYISGFLGDKA
jgi:heat-inducible transcriptional repressor